MRVTIDLGKFLIEMAGFRRWASSRCQGLDAHHFDALRQWQSENVAQPQFGVRLAGRLAVYAHDALFNQGPSDRSSLTEPRKKKKVIEPLPGFVLIGLLHSGASEGRQGSKRIIGHGGRDMRGRRGGWSRPRVLPARQHRRRGRSEFALPKRGGWDDAQA
jgi:hypothetical protein